MSPPYGSSNYDTDRFVLVSNAIDSSHIKDGTIIADDIAINAITENKIANLNVTTAKIADLNVTTGKIADLNVTENKINTNAITNTKINALAVSTEKIADLNVTEGKIADLNITEGKIASFAVTSTKIRDLAVTSGKIADLNVTSGKIADLHVLTSKINDLAVTTAKIADLNVTTEKIADNAITDNKINAFAVTDGKMVNEAVSSRIIRDLAVTTIKIADLNVTEGKIASSSVTNTKIADLAVSTGKIADLNVTEIKLATGAVTNTKIGALAVTEDKISPLAITEYKISPLAVIESKIGALAVTTGKIADLNVTSSKIADLNVTSGKIADLHVTSAKIADLNVTEGKIGALAVTDAKIANTTISLGKLSASAITSLQTTPANSINSSHIQNGTILGEDINSGTITLSNLGTSITSVLDAKANLANPTFTGTLGTSANIIPTINNTIDIGSSGFIFKDAHMNNIYSKVVTSQSGMKINGSATLEFGSGLTKATKAGQIGYLLETETGLYGLDIHGASSPGFPMYPKMVKVHNSLYVEGTGFNQVGSGMSVCSVWGTGSTYKQYVTNFRLVASSYIEAARYYYDYNLNEVVNQGALGINYFNSDIRLKTNIKEPLINDACEYIKKIEFKSYYWKEACCNASSLCELGIIAQQLESVYPKFINIDCDEVKDESKHKSINTNVFSTFMMKGIQELVLENIKLKKDIELIKQHLGI